MVRVALIEDETLIQQLLSLSFQQDPDFEFLGASEDGPAGIEFCLDVKPDVVLVDMILPSLSGVEVVDRLNGAGLRCLAMSALKDPGLIRSALQAGALGFVEKRAPVEDLKKGLKRVASGERYLGEEAIHAMTLQEDEPESRKIKSLTRREREVLREVARGYSVKEISSRLFISENTVKMHRKNLLQKLGVHDAVGLARFALKHHLVN